MCEKLDKYDKVADAKSAIDEDTTTVRSTSAAAVGALVAPVEPHEADSSSESEADSEYSNFGDCSEMDSSTDEQDL